MYKVLKDAGNNGNITIEDTDEKRTTMIGKLSMDILKILEGEGYTFGTEEGETQMKDKWDLSITKDAYDKLRKKAFSIKRPERNQSKKSEQKIDNKKVDAMDVLLGLASYM